MLATPVAFDLGALARAFAEQTRSTGAIIQLSDGARLTVGGAYPPDPAGAGRAGGAGGPGRHGAGGPQRPRHAARRRRARAARSTGTCWASTDGGSVARLCVPARGLGGQILGVVGVHRGVERAVLGRGHDRSAAVRRPARAAAAGDGPARRRRRAPRRPGPADRPGDLRAGVRAPPDRLRPARRGHHGARLDVLPPQRGGAVPRRGGGGVRRVARGGGPGPGAVPDRRRPDAWPTGPTRQTRAAITGLHSLVLDDLGLVAALESLAETAPGRGDGHRVRRRRAVHRPARPRGRRAVPDRPGVHQQRDPARPGERWSR